MGLFTDSQCIKKLLCMYVYYVGPMSGQHTDYT